MTSIKELKAGLEGTAVVPGDDGYLLAAATFLGPGTPDVVVHPSDESDIGAALDYARTNGLTLGVRGGGHGVWGTMAGGLSIDMGTFVIVELTADRIVRVGGGAMWDQVAKEINEHGLAVSSGDTGSVGVGGSVLGGGIGWMVRLWGLALDQLVGARVVTADGVAHEVSADVETELFWALRGGGGNFGVVTRFDFRAHTLPGVVFGTVPLDPSDLAATIRGWRDVMRTAPRELGITLSLGGPAAELKICWAGDDETAARAALQPILDVPGAGAADLHVRQYADILNDIPAPPAGSPVPTVVESNGFAGELDDAMIDAIVAAHAEMGAGMLEVRYLLGAFTDVPADATAVAFRSAEAFILSITMVPPGSADGEVSRIVNRWQSRVGVRMIGTYGNFASALTPEIVPRMYPPATLARLRAIKATWDPEDLFSRNHNIEPSA